MSKELMKIELRNETPLLLGGYDGSYSRTLGSRVIEEGLRAQSIKGLWRWWLRAYIAGALWDLYGYVSEQKVIKLAGKILGSPSGKEAISSSFKVRTELSYSRCDRLSNITRFPRVSLLFVGRGGGYYARNLKALLSVYEVKRKDREHLLGNEERILALGSLITSLILSGIGKGGRRGLGCLNIRVFTDATNRFKRLVNIVSSPDRREEALKNIVLETHRVAKQVVRNHEGSEKEEDMPSIPSLGWERRCSVGGSREPFRLYVASTNKSAFIIAQDIQDFCTRGRRLYKSHGSYTCKDAIVEKHVAWVLGLPREQKEQKKTAHGYSIVKNKVSRRASPFIFTAHNKWMSVSIFFSKDWPESIRWRGGGEDTFLDIKCLDKIYEAYNTVEEVLKEYLKKQGYKLVQVIP